VSSLRICSLTRALAFGLLLLVAGPALAQPAEPERARESSARPSEGLPSNLSPRGTSYGGNLTRFGTGITMAEVASGAAAGDGDRVRDALTAPASPEFLAGLVLFDGSLRAAEAATARLPGSGGAAGYLKHNLALAGALTAASAVEVDLNGFDYGDALTLDFSKLEGAHVGLRSLDLEDVGITVGAFAAAQPLWNASKGLARRFGGMVARRFLRTAAIKGALVAAPTGATQVAAAGLTALDVVLAGADLAGLLLTAHAIEETAGEAYRGWRSSARIREASGRLEALAEQSRQASLPSWRRGPRWRTCAWSVACASGAWTPPCSRAWPSRPSTTTAWPWPCRRRPTC
jgi:hypothetical protein